MIYPHTVMVSKWQNVQHMAYTKHSRSRSMTQECMKKSLQQPNGYTLCIPLHCFSYYHVSTLIVYFHHVYSHSFNGLVMHLLGINRHQLMKLFCLYWLLGRRGSASLCRVERENKMAATYNVLAFKRWYFAW